MFFQGMSILSLLYSYFLIISTLLKNLHHIHKLFPFSFYKILVYPMAFHACIMLENSKNNYSHGSKDKSLLKSKPFPSVIRTNKIGGT